MKNMYLLRGFAALAMGMILASCSSDDFEQQPTEAEAVTLAEEKLGFTFDPNQDWSMTQSSSIDVTVNADIDANEVLILDAYPYGASTINILGHADAKEGQTVTVDYIAPKSLTSVYVACRNANKQYRTKRVDIGTKTVSFKETSTRALHRVQTQTVDNPSKEEIGYSFNAKMSQAWDKFDHSSVRCSTMEGSNTSAWDKTAWNDKLYQINATVEETNMTAVDRADLWNVLKTRIPENENNIPKARQTGYSVTTTGEPITMTPIYRNSSSGGKLGYYYYPTGSKPTAEQIKSMDKYIIGEIGDRTQGNEHVYPNTYHLVYFGEDGNTPQYTFPEGLTVEFFIQNTAPNGTTTVFDGDGEWSTNKNDLKDYFTLTNGVDVGVHDGWSTGNAAGSIQYMNNSNIRFGVEGDPTTFSTPATDEKSEMYYFKVVTQGSNNGHFNDGTVYKIKPYNDGVLEVALQIAPTKTAEVWQSTEGETNQSNAFKIREFHNEATNYALRTSYEFPVRGDRQYSIFIPGNKLGFYGYALFGFNSSPNPTTVDVPITPECYGDGELNNDLHKYPNWARSENNLSHTAVFSIDGKNYLGFEDWNDMDYNDVIFEITGTEGGEEIIPGEPEMPTYSYAFEDSKNGDYDMNDVVLKVREDGDDIVLKLVATGAALDLNIRLYNNDGEDGMQYGKNFITLSYNDKTEVHEMLGAEHGYLTNTGADTNAGAMANPIEIRVPKANYADYRKLRLAIYIPTQKGKEEYEMRLAGSGQAPYGVIIPEDWKWPREWVNITIAYPEFKGFAETAGMNEDWYKTPSGNYVMDESDFLY